MSENIHWQSTNISKTDREKLNDQKACIVWFTGLSGSGKSTIAAGVEEELHKQEKRTYILDGDNIRHGLNKDLGFSNEDRDENIRRISEVAKLFVDAGIIVLASFISPFRKERDYARNIVEENEFIEVHIDCPIETCEERDVKGLYKKARSGEIKNFTGIDSDYEAPLKAEITINSHKQTAIESVTQVLTYMKENQII